ncbi:hypothetical protein G6F37_012478 [Rhizopus arrhizus]|nr:hypothetical protein G6F38_012473 [Rhizopus arrhizus]KAG1143359.1 hypothetical protein G6F37_012478 [Rhizopus arrhizus]
MAGSTVVPNCDISLDKWTFRDRNPHFLVALQPKWYLSTGKCIEDELFAFGMQCHHDHPSHSFIIDTRDSNYKTYEVFSSAELDEIKAFEEKKLPIMPTELRDYINSFNKNSIQELRRQIFQSQEFDQEYSHKDSHDYDWDRFTIYSLLREYEAGSLKKEHGEAWYMAHVWHFIDTVFNGEDEITVLRGETSSSSSSKRKNKDRSIAAVEPLERKKIGKKCDMIFAKKSCSHDKVEEYGASEAGKTYDGDQATKRLEEGLVKLPKCLKDMLDNILPKADDHKKLQTVGFIHSGLQSYVVRADRPTKYITRIQKSRTYHLSSDISQFGTTVLPAIYIAWIIKDIVRNTHNVIQESNTHNNNSNIQGSEWLTQYWEESEKEDAPETSSSQEKILKKSKSYY